MNLIHLFDDVDITDAEAVSNRISSLSFSSLKRQADALQELRDDLGFTVACMAKALSVPKPTMERYLFGGTLMRPTHVKLLAMMLMVRVTEPELFLELFSAASGNKRKKASD